MPSPVRLRASGKKPGRDQRGAFESRAKPRALSGDQASGADTRPHAKPLAIQGCLRRGADCLPGTGTVNDDEALGIAPLEAPRAWPVPRRCTGISVAWGGRQMGWRAFERAGGERGRSAGRLCLGPSTATGGLGLFDGPEMPGTRPSDWRPLWDDRHEGVWVRPVIRATGAGDQVFAHQAPSDAASRLASAEARFDQGWGRWWRFQDRRAKSLETILAALPPRWPTGRSVRLCPVRLLVERTAAA
ncbi:hypothetical protein MASR1M49_24630 [Pararhodobacter aggregans]